MVGNFLVVCLSAESLRVLFETPQVLSTSPLDYTVQTLTGTPVLVVEVLSEQNSRSVVLMLDYSIPDRGLVVVTPSGLATAVAQYLKAPTEVSVPVDRFTGEVSGGLFGTPAGLVFLSPALESPAALSSVQVDDVSTCVLAGDSYEFPALVDPAPLFLWPGPGLLGVNTTWAPKYRLAEFSWNISLLEVDSMSPPTDGTATAVLSEVLDPTKISYLGNPHWVLFDGVNNPFIVSDNLNPIPPGSTTTIYL